MGTLDQVVKQYGLHNLAPLIMLQAKLSIKICVYIMFLSPTILPLQYPLQRATTRRVHPSYLDLPAYTKMRRRQEDCQDWQGLRKLLNTGKKILNYLKLLLRKRNMIIPDVFAVLCL